MVSWVVKLLNRVYIVCLIDAFVAEKMIFFHEKFAE